MKRFFPLLLALLLLIAPSAMAKKVTPSISFEQEHYVVFAGKAVQPDAQIVTGSTRKPAVIWESSDSSIAKVSADGKVKGLSAGTATITATLKKYPDARASVTVEVRMPIKAVTIDQPTLSLLVDGSDAQASSVLRCSFKPANAYYQAIHWRSSDERIATVDENGLVRAVGVGSCEITGTFDDPAYSKSVSCIVSVGQLSPGLTLSHTDTVLAVGKTLKLKTSRWPEAMPKAKYSWSSSDPSVASVNAKGEVKGIAPGSAVITCKAADSSSFSAVCDITVNAPVKTLTVGPRKVVLAVDTQWQTRFSVAPDNATNPTLVWHSSRENVASVTQDGLITGLAPGSCKITVSTVDGSGKSASVIVTVKEFDFVIRDKEGLDATADANIYHGAQYFNLRSRYHKVKVTTNSKRADLDWSTVDLSTFNPDTPHMTPIAQGEDVIMVDVHDLSDYFIHRSAKKWFTVYVTQTALTTEPGQAK